MTLCYLKLVQYFKPYIDDKLNHMKETSLWQIYVIFFLALLIKYTYVDDKVIKYFLIVTFFANFIILFFDITLQYFVVPMIVSRITASTFVTESEDGDTELNCRKTIDRSFREIDDAVIRSTTDRDSSGVRPSSITMSPLRHDSESSTL